MDNGPRVVSGQAGQDDLVGQTISSYRITRKLGEGGFGAVYLGQHPEIESKVAIKVLRPQFVTDSAMVERFLDEARAVNRIGHRGVVRIHDTGRLPVVGVYLVMEYLDGESLLDRFRHKSPLAVEQTVRFIMQACTSLGACHRAGIVHRDLKPANMYVVADEDLPGGERVIILDFGIAKLAQEQEIGRATATGALLGSPLYMSPEQCLDSKHVDHRSDIFSLGVVTYELLGGKCPYVADTLGQLVLKHSNEEPAPLRSLRADLPSPLEQAVSKALEHNPGDRYQNMEELRRTLDLACFGSMTSHQPTPAPGSSMNLDTIGDAETIAPDSEELPPDHSTAQLAESSSTAADLQALSGGRKPGHLLAAAAALALLGGVGLYVGLSGEVSSPVATDPGTASATNTPAPGTPPPVAKAARKMVPLPPVASDLPPADGQQKRQLAVITLDLSPASAVAELDGQPVKGKILNLPPSRKPRNLKVSAAGYVTVHHPLVVDGTRTVRVGLQRARSGEHASANRGKSGVRGKGRPVSKSGKAPKPVVRPAPKKPTKKKLYFDEL